MLEQPRAPGGSEKKEISAEEYNQLVEKVAQHTEELVVTSTQLESQARDIQRLKSKFNAMEECGLFNKRKYYMGVLFSFVDTDLSGYIDINELTLFLSSLKARDVHHRLVERIVQKYDLDKNAKLDPKEFEGFISAILTMSFEKLDDESNGKLTLKECEKLVDVALGNQVEEKSLNKEEQIEYVFRTVDTDSSGFIDKEEFIDFVIEKIVRTQQQTGKGAIFMAEAIGKIVKFNSEDFGRLADDDGQKSISMTEKLKILNAKKKSDQDEKTEPPPQTKKSKSVLFKDLN